MTAKYIVLNELQIQEFVSDDRCCLCNKLYDSNDKLCSKKHMYCYMKKQYYPNHDDNEIYDSYYDMNLPITKHYAPEGCAEIENKRQYIREFQFNYNYINKESFSVICNFVFLVKDYYPSMLTEKHKRFIDITGFRSRELNNVTVKYTINDLRDLLILNTDCVLKPKINV